MNNHRAEKRRFRVVSGTLQQPSEKVKPNRQEGLMFFYALSTPFSSYLHLII